MTDSSRDWRVAALNDIAEPGALEFRVGEGDWPFRGFVVRWQGQLHAYKNFCPHAGHPLNFKPDGFFNLDQSLLICGSHGAVFTPENGKCVGGPCPGLQLEKLECRVENGDVYVHAPNSQRA
ncbi:MAG: Rieske (2Fe-2S) protein [Gammaproteobacteria bacterium]